MAAMVSEAFEIIKATWST